MVLVKSSSILKKCTNHLNPLLCHISFVRPYEHENRSPNVNYTWRCICVNIGQHWNNASRVCFPYKQSQRKMFVEEGSDEVLPNVGCTI